MSQLITGSVPTPQSMSVQIQVVAGRSQVQRKVGDYSAIYFADQSSIQDQYFELDSMKVWQSNPQETYQKLIISCSGVLTLNAIKADGSELSMQINRLCVIDSELRTLTLSNVGEDTVRAQMNSVTARI